MSAVDLELVMPTLLTEQEIIDAVSFVNKASVEDEMSEIVTYSKNMQFIAVSTDVSAREIAEQYEGFASYIALGDTDGLLRFIRTDMPLMEPKTSDDPLLQGRSAVAFLSSTCIEAARKGGLPAIRSFAITQHYMNLANETSNEEVAHYLVLPMMLELTKAVRKEGKARTHPLSHQAMNYVRSHLSQRLDGDSVANALGVSRKTLCTRFKNETGETFAAYVRRVRVERARRLLDTTDYDIAQIAYQTGFSSQSHLQTAFKHATGLTPREWRIREIREI
ncbi:MULTISPECIES: helix-turn-helix domain-containing protein [Atopobiaceae]|uniref:Helix-turn-helix domain-containing protein n=1 Tax=Parafannyhessea umbonata TaxID=604330 RepID=A0A1H9PXV8_9ACTN|nr:MULTISPECIES: AraC family transcriptional regulator [Atopobiaceae]SEH46879.1 Helix-turn-helix domain-containing protein [Parafannyhessea umbonata]SER52609.1 Helix-turn-helix domain-containing protein [Parafannyhessea umbonata]SJZ69978.1 Helix-turn-helix domain-containing protein [Olsenella sp. KH1P3]